MKLEQQVVSLELAKQLKELGVKQDSLFYWFNMEREKDYYDDGIGWHYNKVGWHVVGKDEIERYKNDREIDNSEFTPISHYRSAFTVAELGKMLPIEIADKNSDGLKRLFFFDTWKCNKGSLWRCAYSYYENMGITNTRIEYLKGNDGGIQAETEADARASMCIWLIKNGYVKVEELNK